MFSGRKEDLSINVPVQCGSVITSDTLSDDVRAGANSFEHGSALFKPGNGLEEIGAPAMAFVQAYDRLVARAQVGGGDRGTRFCRRTGDRLANEATRDDRDGCVKRSV